MTYLYRTIFSNFIHIVMYSRISFLCKAEYYSTVCICHILCIHSLADEYLSRIQILAIVNNAAMKVKVAQLCLTICNSLSQNTVGGSLSLLHGISPIQGSNRGLPHCGQILYQLRHKGSPRILEWLAYLFSRGSSQPRNQTRVSCIAGRFFAAMDMQKSVQVSVFNSFVI